VRDLRFLAALEMTNRGRRRIFAIPSKPPAGERTISLSTLALWEREG
jgi:hypothetical protein